MKQLTKKVLASLLVCSMAISFASCSLFDKSAEEVKESADEYFSKVIKGKDVSKLVEGSKKSKKDDDEDDKEDDSSAALSDEQKAILDAILENASYEITETSGSKKDEEGSATIEFTYVDAEKIASDDKDADLDKIVDEIGSAKDKEKETKEFEISFVLDDENWLVSAKSDKKVQEFINGLVDEIEFSKINQKDLIDFIDSYYNNLMTGNVQGALDLTNSGKTSWQEYGLDSANNQFVDDYDAVYGAFFKAGSYEIAEVSVIDETSASVTVNGMTPSLDSIMQVFANDKNAVANVLSGVLYSQITKKLDTDWVEPYLNSIVGYTSQAELESYTYTFDISVNEDGSFVITSDPSSMLPDWKKVDTSNILSNLTSDEKYEIYTIAFGILKDDGKITQEQYDALIASLNNQGSEPQATPTPAPAPADIKTIDDVFMHPQQMSTNSYDVYNNVYGVKFCTTDKYTEVEYYTEADEKIMIEVSTQNYHKKGDTFYYEVYSGAGDKITSGTYVEQTDDVDDIYVEIPVKSANLKAGSYTFVFFDTNSKESVICVAFAIVKTQ